MSWSCDVCGGDRYDGHVACQQVGALDKIAELLEAVHADNPWRRATFLLIGALIASLVLR